MEPEGKRLDRIVGNIKSGIDFLSEDSRKDLKRIVLLVDGPEQLVDTCEIITPLCQRLDELYPIKFFHLNTQPPEVDSSESLSISVEDKHQYVRQQGDYSVYVQFLLT